MKKIMRSALFFSFGIISLPLHSTQAVVIVPIADLVGQPLQTVYPAQSVQKSYADLPLCGGTIKNELNCLRIHQLLFNETVEVLEEKDEEICVRIPHLFYITTGNPHRHDSYWMLKNAVIPIPALTQIPIDCTTIPYPIFYQKNKPSCVLQERIALLEPWYDIGTHMTFSAGTHFVVDHYSLHNARVNVWRYNPLIKKNEIISFPTSITIVLKSNVNPSECIDIFLTILHKWIQTPIGAISYVLGGCSFTHRTKKNFTHHIKTENKSTLSFYQRAYDTAPKNGFDCSGLISRAAQMAGIPYFFKNTLTLAHYLDPVTPQETLTNGDLIWIAGHVMIISDIKNNLLIEARSYQHGYGKVHEIALNKVFKNINTYADLKDAYHNKKPIVRIDKNGKEQDVFNETKLLSMQSCWKKFFT